MERSAGNGRRLEKRRREDEREEGKGLRIKVKGKGVKQKGGNGRREKGEIIARFTYFFKFSERHVIARDR